MLAWPGGQDMPVNRCAKNGTRSAGKIIGSHLKCKFSSFMASGGTCIKLEVYSINHNMLRT